MWQGPKNGTLSLRSRNCFNMCLRNTKGQFSCLRGNTNETKNDHRLLFNDVPLFRQTSHNFYSSHKILQPTPPHLPSSLFRGCSWQTGCSVHLMSIYPWSSHHKSSVTNPPKIVWPLPARTLFTGIFYNPPVSQVSGLFVTLTLFGRHEHVGVRGRYTPIWGSETKIYQSTYGEGGKNTDLG